MVYEERIPLDGIFSFSHLKLCGFGT